MLLVGGAAALFWRLDQGPISLAPVADTLAGLIARGTPYIITFADPALALSRDENALTLTVTDVEVRRRSGEFVAEAPSAGVRFDAWSFVRDRALVIREVELALPSMQLVREGERQLTLYFSGQLAALPLGQSTGPGTLPSLLGSGDEASDPRVEALRHIEVSAASLQYFDVLSGQLIETGRADLALSRESDGWGVGFDVALADGSGAVRAALYPGATPQSQSVTIDFDAVPAAMLGGVVPDLDLGDSSLRLSGRAEFPFDTADLRPGPGRFRLSSDGGSLALPDELAEPLTVGPFTARGSAEAGWQVARVEPTRLAVNGTELEVAADLHPGRGLHLALESAGLPVDTALALWPLRAGRRAREWVAERIPAGEIRSFNLDLPLNPDPDVALDLTMAGASVRFIEEWPPATGVAGRVALGDGRLDVALDAGAIGDITLERGSVAITELRTAAPSRLATEVEIAGPVPSALRLLALPPLRLDAGPVTAEDTEGRARGTVRVGFVLAESIPPDAVEVDARMRIEGLVARDALGERDVTGGSVDLAVTQDRADARGTLALEGVTAEVTWAERFEAAERRRVRVQSGIDPGEARALGAAWDGFTGGEAQLDATLIKPARGPQRIEGAIDLVGAAVAIPQLAIDKPVGQPGQLTAQITDATPELWLVDRFKAELGGAVAEGSMQLDGESGAWRRLSLDRLAWPAGSLQASLTRDGEAIAGSVDAQRLDLRGLVDAGGPQGASSGATPPLTLDVRAREMLLIGSVPTTDLSARLERDAAQWRSLRGRATLPEGYYVTVDYDATRVPGILAVDTTDFTRVLGVLGIEGVTLGGRGRLDAILVPEAGGPRVEGELRARDFRLRNSPTIARILSLASFQGIADTFAGRGLQIDRLTVPFIRSGERVQLRQARLYGSEIGSRIDGEIRLDERTLALQGTVAPFYTLNRLLGQIPLVGGFFRGDRQDALLAATFGVTGPIGNPDVTVNPLSAVVPGVVRDLFRDYGTPVEEERDLQRER